MKLRWCCPLAFGLLACGGAAREPSTVASAEARREPTTAEEAEVQVKDALAQLEPTAAPAMAPTPEPQPKAQAQSEATNETRYAAKEESVECRAFRSLERATDALCRLAGDKDQRCVDARSAVDRNRTRALCN